MTPEVVIFFTEDGFLIYLSGTTKWAKVRDVGPVLREGCLVF
jgi:hypothetical protein